MSTKKPSDYDDWQDIAWAIEIVLHLAERILVENLHILKMTLESSAVPTSRIETTTLQLRLHAALIVTTLERRKDARLQTPHT